LCRSTAGRCCLLATLYNSPALAGPAKLLPTTARTVDRGPHENLPLCLVLSTCAGGSSSQDQAPFKPSDLGSLPLLTAVIKEALRLLPPTPLGGVRVCTEDNVQLCGFKVPKVGALLTGDMFMCLHSMWSANVVQTFDACVWCWSCKAFLALQLWHVNMQRCSPGIPASHSSNGCWVLRASPQPECYYCAPAA
jgi:hypothetical protein